jgi:hypothetical protein
MCLWVYDQLVWPRRAGDPEPKLHAPPNVRREYEEAGQTLEASRAAQPLFFVWR